MKEMGGEIDWRKVSETEMRALSEKMFDAAKVPQKYRDQYWKQFEDYKRQLKDRDKSP